jgi:hypothetical protein
MVTIEEFRRSTPMEQQTVYFGTPGGKLESVTIKEGDTVLLTSPLPLEREQVEALRTQAELVVRSIGFRDVKVIVLGHGAKLTVIPQRRAA